MLALGFLLLIALGVGYFVLIPLTDFLYLHFYEFLFSALVAVIVPSLLLWNFELTTRFFLVFLILTSVSAITWLAFVGQVEIAVIIAVAGLIVPVFGAIASQVKRLHEPQYEIFLGKIVLSIIMAIAVGAYFASALFAILILVIIWGLSFFVKLLARFFSRE